MTKIEFLASLELDCINDNLDQCEEANSYDELYQIIQQNRGFDVESIYSGVAMDYLKENDPSLRDSMEEAAEMGMEIGSLSSEVLASILASKKMRDDFEEKREEIEEFFEEAE